MSKEDMVIKTLEEIESREPLNNPWEKYKIENFQDGYVSKDDLDGLKPLLSEKVFWENTTGDRIQIPVPINGNFLRAKYLLLYSNPGTEKSMINDISKEKLLKCFNLDVDAELVIPNEQWFRWYTGELDKFYTERNDDFDWEKFSSDFCFINFFAYPTKKNKFNFNTTELETIKGLPSTKFVEKLVEIGIEAKKEIVIIRRSEGVWKHSKEKKNYLFKKLSSSYSKYMMEKADEHLKKNELDEAKIIFEILKNYETKAKANLKKMN